MTTDQLLPGVSNLDATRLEKWLAENGEHRVQRSRERRARRLKLALALWRFLRPLLLFVVAMVCLVVAAFQVSIVAGLVAAGVACLVTEWRVNGG